MRENNIKFIIDYLRAYYTWEFLSGLLGNIKVETANTFDPKTVQKGKKDKNNKNYTNDTYMFAVLNGDTNFILDRVGWGLFQLTTSGRKGRFADFIGNMRNMGDFATQLEWFKYEITLTGFANVRKAIKENWSLEQCARIICTEYERPGSMQKDEATKEKAIQNRIDCAKAIYEEFKDYYYKDESKEEINMANYNVTVCIDRGHYAKANKSPVVPTYYESDMTWKLGGYLSEELRASGIKVIDTRASKDKDLALVKRGKMANNCFIFVSLHSNACGTESIDHPSIIIPRVEGDVNIEACTILANRLGASIKATMGCKQDAKVYSRDAEYDRNGDKKGGNDEYYGVMHGAQSVTCPIYFIAEHGFHTNKANALWLSDENNIKKLAKADAKVIIDFIREKYGEKVNVDTSNDKNEVTPEVTYKVKKGDTLGAIAKAYHTTPEAIQEVNKIITNPNLIQPGWILIIPFEVKDLPQYHVVDAKKDGLNSLSKIAKRYGTTTEALKKLNPDVLPPKYYIYNGDRIRIK